MKVKTFYTHRGADFTPDRSPPTELNPVILSVDKVFDSQFRKNLEHKGFAK